jgi:formylglycine-generating enzyme required for sulfatase activity
MPDIVPGDVASLRDRLTAIPGGRAIVGTDAPFFPGDGEGPERPVMLKPFHIDPHTVPNAWFERFIAATGYRTDAERFGWSLVFKSMAPDDPDAKFIVETPWWQKVAGADWAHPFGPASSCDGLEDHPVVHVSWTDAQAFAKWAGGRLPGEAEWEHAAKGGDPSARYPWGNTEPTDDEPLCNIWQGSFPDHNTGKDGYLGTAPVGSLTPNAHGLHNMSGNVWEWCADTFRLRSPNKRARLANQRALAENIRVLKGGSFMCHKSYCYRYRVAARTGATADTSTGHTGFRIAL